MPPRKTDRQKILAQTARETLKILPGILEQLPHLNATKSTLYTPETLPPLPITKGDDVTPASDNKKLTPSTSPKLATRASVLDVDTLDAAISLLADKDENGDKKSRVAVLNLASDITPGGGWRSGALAQEECLCYRSSLALSLRQEYYPLPPEGVIYSPDVVVIREAWGNGHGLLVGELSSAGKDGDGGDGGEVETGGDEEGRMKMRTGDLPVVSVISVAAIRRPRLRTEPPARTTYANPADAELMKLKMRMALRVAAHHGHRKIVLGALGCGAFRNPTEEVAMLWKDVLCEGEFCGLSRWDEVVFAVLDKGSDGGNSNVDREGNFSAFHRLLDGLCV